MIPLTLVMYHYVRDLRSTPYPRIKALEVDDFCGQLDYIMRHYRVCGVGDVCRAVRGGPAPAGPACVLTFDDGLMDHYDTVFPILQERGLTASFYAPALAAEQGAVLEVHKIHFILASAQDASALVDETLAMLAGRRAACGLPQEHEWRARYWSATRFDGAEIAFLKRLLQHGVPPAVRAQVVGELFARHVTEDEFEFARGLYMSKDQLKQMQRAGMELGGHGVHHNWLEHLDAAGQAAEIEGTLKFLSELHGQVPKDWVMCCPYGSYNRGTLELLRQAGCALGLSTRVDLARDLRSPLELPRLDTNDLPRRADAQVCSWTAQALTQTATAVVDEFV